MPNDRFQDNRVDALSVRNQDFNGRRIVMASDGIDPQDYVTVRQLKGEILNFQRSNASTIPSGTVITDDTTGVSIDSVDVTY